METATQLVDAKFLAAIYTIGAIVILLDIMIWGMEGVMKISILGGVEFLLVVSGTIMAFHRKTRASRNAKKIIWFYSIMVAQAMIAIGGLVIVAMTFGTGVSKGVGILTYAIFAARSILIASAAILILKFHATDENEGCPRIHIISRSIVAICGFCGVLTRCIFTVTRESLIELPFTIISWICISGICIGIVLGYTLKVPKAESKFV